MGGKRGWLLILLALFAAAQGSRASGPRYVTGPPFFTGQAGVGIGWKQANLLYSTDPGALGPKVNHAAADALVAAAASVWNVPVASITLGQGAPLAEHVSGQNVYLSTDGMVWPADVASANAAAVPIALLYDTDGSVTETLLGGGASDPSGCQQNAVTESVDAFDPAGYILHALIVLNGRCTGGAPEQQKQMQYQLERAFGRVLGLAWTQTNDNMFTGVPQPTLNQAMHWPIMHPLEILCGPYSFQCLPEPFTLRPDDVAGLVGLYPNQAGITLAPGKQASLDHANPVNGSITFPSGEGMAGVNVLVRRTPRFSVVSETWFEASAVTGSSFQRGASSPFVNADASMAGSFGANSRNFQGFYLMPYLEIVGPNGQGEIVTTEPVNPLYIGDASVGPYAPGMVSPAGSTPLPFTLIAGPTYPVTVNFAIADAPPACGDGADGTPSLPMVLPPSGWWNGLLCGYGHASYVAAEVKAGRSLTVEVTALDENGFATTTKAMPVIGLFAPEDQAGSLPSLGVTPLAFQSVEIGTTKLNAAPFKAGGGDGLLRIGIADQRGDGRPDFSYQARLFYADSITPAVAAASTASGKGPEVTITGSGFRAGNAVTVNGVEAAVKTWSPTTIVLTVPTMLAAGAASGTPVDVAVRDLGTGATSIMTAALTYEPAGSLPNTMVLVSAPSALMFVGDTASVPFSVRVLKGDGVTPVAGETVTFSASLQADFGTCAAAPCRVTTDAQGLASTAVMPEAAGQIALEAADGAATVSATFEAELKPKAMKISVAPAATQQVGSPYPDRFLVQIVNSDGTGIAGELVTFSVTQGAATFVACNATPCSFVSNQWGQAQMQVTATAAGPVTLLAADGSLSQSTSFVAVGGADTLTLLSAPRASGYVNDDVLSVHVRLLEQDGVSRVLAAPVVFSAPQGLAWNQCGTNVCVVYTDWSGEAVGTVRSSVPGNFTVQAAYGSSAVQSSIEVGVRTKKLTVLSAPSGSLTVGKTSRIPFSAQLVDEYGNPMGDASINVGGLQGLVKMGCGLGSCIMTSDGNGVVTSTVTPLNAGTVVLTATWLDLNATASFLAVGGSETLNVLLAPPAQVSVGDKIAFTLQLLNADGVTPVAWYYIDFAETLGSIAFDQCRSTACHYATDGNGIAAMTATVLVPGPVTYVASVDGLTQQMSFAAAAKVYTLKVLSAPTGSVQVGSAAAAPFAVQVLAADGVTPGSGQNVTFSLGSSGGGVQLAACAGTPCVVQTDASGTASTGVITGTVPGAVILLAADNALSATATFSVVARPDSMALVSVPANGSVTGSAATTAFSVRVTSSDGASLTPGRSVMLTVTGGTLGACGTRSCTVVTDASGLASSAVTPTAAGTVALTAVEQGAGQTASVSAMFTAVNPPDLVSVGGAPASVFEGATTATPFTVRVRLADGSTAAAGVPVVLSVAPGGSGAVLYAACGAARCSLTTDANGEVASLITGTRVGGVGLTATARLTDGDHTVSAGFAVDANVRSLTGLQTRTYVAEGASVAIGLDVTAMQNGVPAAGQAIAWTGSGSVALAGSSSVTDASGHSAMQATAGPLGPGVTGTAVACAWSTVCAAFDVTGVPGSAWRISIVSGGQQMATGGTALQPLVAQVTDMAGHALPGATVNVGQTVRALDAQCPVTGRCPAAPVLASSSSVLTSDAQGNVTIAPLVVLGTASTTDLAFSAGTQGFATAQVWSTP